MAITYLFGMTAKKIRDVLPTAKTAEDKETLVHAPLGARTNLVVLPPSVPHDYTALAQHIDNLRRDNRLPEGTENCIFSQTLTHKGMDSIAATTQGNVREAAAECARNLRMCSDAGYPLVNAIFSAMGQPSLTHANEDRETIYSDLSNAPLRIAATEAIAPMPPRRRRDGSAFRRGEITSITQTFLAESAALLHFAGAAHGTAQPVWHQNCETRGLTLSLQAHK